MNRSDFKEGGVAQLIYDYWDGRLRDSDVLKCRLMRIKKEDLVDFIMEAQSKGRFGELYIHP